MRKDLLCVVLVLLVWAPLSGWGEEISFFGSGEAGQGGPHAAISSAAELSAAITGDASMELEVHEAVVGQVPEVTLAVSTVIASTAQARLAAATQDELDDPAILLSLGAYPALRVLSFFGPEQRRLLQETYIESERVFERTVRGGDLPLWQELATPAWERVTAPPVQQQAGFENTPVAINQDYSYADSASTVEGTL